MSVDSKWWSRTRWTLIEAAQICAGVNPYQGESPTDSPHTVAARITDTQRRELFNELYARSKDSLENDLPKEEESRTGYLGNVRVLPAQYLMWVIDLPLPQHLDALVPKDQFPLAFQGSPSAPILDRNDGEELGPTLEEAAKTLAQVGNTVEGSLLDRLWRAVQAGDLELIDPQTKIPTAGAPRTRRDWFYRVRVTALNKWLDGAGAPYRYPTPATASDSHGRAAETGGQALSTASKGKNPAPVWQSEARRVADEIDRRDRNAGAYSSLTDIAERVATDMRERGIEGMRGPLTHPNIRREALQGGRWRRRPK